MASFEHNYQVRVSPSILNLRKESLRVQLAKVECHELHYIMITTMYVIRHYSTNCQTIKNARDELHQRLRHKEDHGANSKFCQYQFLAVFWAMVQPFTSPNLLLLAVANIHDGPLEHNYPVRASPQPATS